MRNRTMDMDCDFGFPVRILYRPRQSDHGCSSPPARENVKLRKTILSNRGKTGERPSHARAQKTPPV